MGSRGGTRQEVVTLTKREREIVSALLEGCSNKEMAEQFETSEQTIKSQPRL